MTDDLDALKAALKSVPAPDPVAKAAALALAMDNFDRLQGSTDASRLSQDRPKKAGTLNGVLKMLSTLKTRPYLAATTSAAALLIGLIVALPQTRSLQDPMPQPVVSDGEIGQIVRPAETPREMADLGRSDGAIAGNVASPDPVAVLEADASALAEATRAAPAPSSGMPKARGEGAAQNFAAAPSIALDAVALDDRSPSQGGAEETERGLMPSVPMTADVATLAPTDRRHVAPEPNSEAFSTAAPSPVHVTAEEPVSTFSVDVDTASWSVIRSSLNAGQLPPPQAVRIEEMVNYFPYDYPAPQAGGAPFTTTVSVMPTPWNPNTRLVHIALQGRLPDAKTRPPLNLVFLIDTSGSMNEPNKLPLLKQSLALMLSRLGAQDRVAIVAYAGAAGEVLQPTPASNRDAILNALNNLEAGGGTAGAEGLALAYQVARGMKADGRVSRVVLATDGDFNVGIDDPEDLRTYIASERDGGTYLSVLGFGRGNLDDATMQALAQNGNGTASYIDTLSEAQKVLRDQLTGALFPIADDVKIQVEWNPTQVAEYRLIGYETRALQREDFNNDRVDAGEIGAGLQVTALYEVTAPGSPALLNDPLRYGPAPLSGDMSELGFLRLRYKEPGQGASKLIETPIAETPNASVDERFAAAIAGFGQLLQHATYVEGWGWDQAIALATAARGPDEYGYRTEAVQLMRLAQSLDAQ